MEVILLTGASGGLGYELANTLLEQGYFVILHYEISQVFYSSFL